MSVTTLYPRPQWYRLVSPWGEAHRVMRLGDYEVLLRGMLHDPGDDEPSLGVCETDAPIQRGALDGIIAALNASLRVPVLLLSRNIQLAALVCERPEPDESGEQRYYRALSVRGSDETAGPVDTDVSQDIVVMQQLRYCVPGQRRHAVVIVAPRAFDAVTSMHLTAIARTTLGVPVLVLDDRVEAVKMKPIPAKLAQKLLDESDRQLGCG